MPLKRAVIALLTLAPLAWAPAARADVKQACVAASTEGQALRDGAKLTQARERFVACARDECPAIVRKYCAEWLTDVERRVPSAVFRAQAADGGDASDAQISVDGHAIARGQEGTAITLDPGEHAVRASRGEGAVVESRVVLAEGEKGRMVTLRFPAAAVAEASGSPSPAAPSARGVSWLTWGLAGVGAAGLAGFTYFGLTARSDLDHLRTTCAPFCASSDLDSAKGKALVADVSLGVGVVALGLAAYTFFARPGASDAPDEKARAARLDLRPVPGGGVAGVSGRF